MAYLTVEKQTSYFPSVFRNAIKNLFNLKFSYFWVTNRWKLCIKQICNRGHNRLVWYEVIHLVCTQNFPEN